MQNLSEMSGGRFKRYNTSVIILLLETSNLELGLDSPLQKVVIFYLIGRQSVFASWSCSAAVTTWQPEATCAPQSQRELLRKSGMNS